jgi:hypothetical protein
MRSSAKYIWIFLVIFFVGGFLLVQTSGLLGRALGVPAQLLDASARNAQSGGFSLGFGPGGLSFGFKG